MINPPAKGDLEFNMANEVADAAILEEFKNNIIENTLYAHTLITRLMNENPTTSTVLLMAKANALIRLK
jgi:hypothetical protein